MKVLQYNRLERLVGDKHLRIGPCYIADFPLANTVAHWAMLHCTGLPWTNTGVLGWVHFIYTRLERFANGKHSGVGPCYISLGWKGLPRTNTAHSYVTKKMK
jgi:hypothetical protein